jgi:hypothetical protein
MSKVGYTCGTGDGFVALSSQPGDKGWQEAGVLMAAHMALDHPGQEWMDEYGKIHK